MANTSEAWYADIHREISQQLAGKLHYIRLEKASVLHVVMFGWKGWVCTVGHPGEGSYEWVGRHDVEVVDETPALYEHSNCGYTSVAAALRDGLVKMVE